MGGEGQGAAAAAAGARMPGGGGAGAAMGEAIRAQAAAGASLECAQKEFARLLIRHYQYLAANASVSAEKKASMERAFAELQRYVGRDPAPALFPAQG